MLLVYISGSSALYIAKESEWFCLVHFKPVTSRSKTQVLLFSLQHKWLHLKLCIRFSDLPVALFCDNALTSETLYFVEFLLQRETVFVTFFASWIMNRPKRVYSRWERKRKWLLQSCNPWSAFILLEGGIWWQFQQNSQVVILRKRYVSLSLIRTTLPR